MTIVYTADVFCDGCGDWSEGTTNRGSASGLAAEARECAKVDKYVRLRDMLGRYGDKGRYVDLCPECAKNNQSKQGVSNG